MKDLFDIVTELEGVSGILTILHADADDRSAQIGTALRDALYCTRNCVDRIVESVNDFGENHTITPLGGKEVTR